MKYRILLISLFVFSIVFSQPNFKMELRKANPVKHDSNLSIDQIIDLHTLYLQKAISEKNNQKQLYGYLFLYVDYYKKQDYVKLNECFLKADKIVKKSNNKSWEGAIHMRKALIYDLNENINEELKEYKLALEKCTIAGDSLCIGESLEQISTVYKRIKNFELANQYYKKALPILNKYADSQQMALTYNNYGILLKAEGKYTLSERYLDSAISLTKKNKDLYKEMMYLNNKASLLTSKKDYKSAIKIFESCEKINIKNKWADHLKQNYIGLSVLYETKDDYKNAFYYLKEFYLLKDSINGLDVNIKIADLNAKYDMQAKEISLKEARLKVVESDRKIEKIYGLLVLTVIIVSFVLFVFFQKIKVTKKDLELNREKLIETKNLLIQKNNLLAKKEDELKYIFKNNNKDMKYLDIYSLRILTESDWAAFKKYFENLYPNYIKNIRLTFPKITESEERLFLCLKLNMKSKEIASVLGISSESVKKGRNRLRKKINLNIGDDLDDFVMNFK